MESLQELMDEYGMQLEKGKLQMAYKGLMEYILALKGYFQKKYPEYIVSGGLYFGYMDMTYFSFNPKSFKDRGLRVAIVFIHEKLCFEAWLAGINKQVQAKYWKLLRESSWDKYPVVPSLKGSDSIVECVLADKPDFDNLDSLNRQIEVSVTKFIDELETFLRRAEHENEA